MVVGAWQEAGDADSRAEQFFLYALNFGLTIAMPTLFVAMILSWAGIHLPPMAVYASMVVTAPAFHVFANWYPDVGELDEYGAA